MWYLSSADDERVIYLTPDRSKIIIGRQGNTKECDFSMEDHSVSRKHAQLYITDDSLMLEDLGSRYGTFVNKPDDEKNSGIGSNVPVKLLENDLVRFGILNCKWRVSKVVFVSCTSTVKGDTLSRLQFYLSKLGGIYKGEWDHTCNYLTMPVITLTIKVVLALAQGAHIVSMLYWSKCSEALTKDMPLPDPKKHMPEIIEPTLNKEIVSFAPNESRKTLFTGKRFIFLSKRQMEMYKDVIEKVSGTVSLLSESKMTKSMLVSPEVIVIQYVLSNASQVTLSVQNQINSIVNYLKTKNKRLVADAEIGLAILYCSLEKYCNPDFNFSSEVIKGTTECQKSGKVLVQESEDITKCEKQSHKVIDASLISKADEDISEVIVKEEPSNSMKRKLSEVDDTADTVSKKRIIEDIPQVNESDSIQEPPLPQKSDDSNRLKFSKPLKRKPDFASVGDGEMINFIPINNECSSESNDNSNNTACQSNDGLFAPQAKRPKTEESVSANDSVNENYKLPLETLISNLKWKSIDSKEEPTIKKENSVDDIEEKLGDVSLGVTIVIMNDKLIKDNRVSVVRQNNNQVVNFKKFKKVWPLKRQETIIKSSSMNVFKPDGSVIGDLESSSSDDEVIITGHKPRKNQTLHKYFSK